MTLTSKLIFRKGTSSLINICNDIGLPIVVLSGGITELIDAAFKILKVEAIDLDYENIKIVANRFNYDEQRCFNSEFDPLHLGSEEIKKVSGFKVPVVHPASKQTYLYEHDKSTLPKNLIVMGDIIEDSKMPRDKEHEHLVKIGFFNSQEG